MRDSKNIIHNNINMYYYDFIIVGGGMAGMTSALLLKKHLPDKKVLLIEKNGYLGGMVHDEFENGKYVEHSPRVFLSSYHNFYNIIKQIPGVWDNLSKPLDNKIIRKDGVISSTNDLFFEISPYSFARVAWHISTGLFRTDDTTKFFSLLDDYSADKLKILAHILGETPNDLPRHKIQIMIEDFIRSGGKKPRNFIGPTHLCLIEPWEKELERLGVDILKNTEVLNLHKNTHILLNTGETIYGGNFILAVPPKGLNGLMDQEYKELEQKTLAHHASAQMYFSRKIKLTKFYGYFSIDSDWQMIVASYDELWDKKYSDMLGKGSVWSINIADPELYSKRLGKRFSECNDEEKDDEILFQIKDFMNLDLKEYLTDSNHSIVPYYLNSPKTIAIRPKQKTKYNNVFIGGTMTDTSFYNSYVESAVESAFIICSFFISDLGYHKHKRLSHALISTSAKLSSIFLACFFIFLLFFNSVSISSK